MGQMCKARQSHVLQWARVPSAQALRELTL